MSPKRVFDLIVTAFSAVLWLPALIVCSLAIAISSGMPVFYRSKRRVYRDQAIRTVKFRTMVRNAEQLANRHTVPVEGQRFLNIPTDSPLYTSVGRWLERFCLTEIPQIWHVLRGEMSLVGNRPLPENVIQSLREAYPYAEDRFEVPCGLTGPVQLVGRDFIEDHDRLRLEIEYCRLVRLAYSPLLDFTILLYTVLMGVRLIKPMTVQQVSDLMSAMCSIPQPHWPMYQPRQAASRAA